MRVALGRFMEEPTVSDIGWALLYGPFLNCEDIDGLGPYYKTIYDLLMAGF
jgi:hypothetical protein